MREQNKALYNCRSSTVTHVPMKSNCAVGIHGDAAACASLADTDANIVQ